MTQFNILNTHSVVTAAVSLVFPDGEKCPENKADNLDNVDQLTTVSVLAQYITNFTLNINFIFSISPNYKSNNSLSLFLAKEQYCEEGDRIKFNELLWILFNFQFPSL